MDNNQKNMIGEVLAQKKTESEAAMISIYKGIARNVMAQPPERLALAILQEESPKVNDYIRTLRQSLKAECVKTMLACGLSEAAAGIVWANVMNAVGLPKVSLCQKQDVPANAPAHKVSEGPSRKQREEINRLEATRNLSIGIAAVGAVAGVVTCLVVPGWSGVAGLVKVASIVVVGAGAAGAVTSQLRIEEINRIVNQVQQQGPSKEDLRGVVTQVCKHQCKTNGQIIHQWLDRVQEEVIAQCEIELAR